MITYTYQDAVNLASRNIPRSAEDDSAAFLCNLALNEMWRRWDWRESVAELPPFYLIPNHQDYGPPAASVPSDFAGLRRAWLVQTTSSPAMRQPMKVMGQLDVTHVRNLPHAVGYEPSTSSFRIFPRSPDNIGATDYMIDGVYKKRPTKVLATTLTSTSLPFDDVYLNVWLEGLKWAAWNANGDPRAGDAQLMPGGQVVYTGQYGKFLSEVDKMAEHEGIELSTPPLAPAEPLVYPSGMYRSGLLGWYGL